MNDRFILITSILLFHSVFVYLDDGSGIGRIIQCVSTFTLILLLLFKKKYKLLPPFKIINKYVVMYSIGLIVISYLSKDINKHSFDSLGLGTNRDLKLSSYTLGILQALSVLTSFIYIENISSVNKTELLFRIFYKVSLFYIIISDLAFILFNSFGSDSYLIGNKFSLCYLHIFCYVFYLMYAQNTNIKPLRFKCVKAFLVITTLLISILTECSTVLIGMMFFIFLLKIKRKYGFFLFKLKTYYIMLALGVLFIFFYSFVLDIKIVQDLIVNVLHEDLTLTGRTSIYEALIPIVFVRPLTGMGVGNAHYVLQFVLGVPNAQNGLMNLYLEEGVICTILYLLIFASLLKFVKNKSDYSLSAPILCCIFVFFFMAFVEITIDNSLLVVMSFLIACDYNKYNVICRK